ncbi:MAG: RraA family protein [Planctomycetes bacterium]|nr:RraA family protein [Planctomycetota bacterium]
MTPQGSLSDRLERCYSGAVYDVLRERRRPQQVLPSTIRPLAIDTRLAGPVYTVAGRYDDSLDAHETLLRWTELLALAPPGSVVVCQPNDSTLAHMGELSSETLQRRGVRGYIVDGGCRDSAFISRIGFRVFCRYFTPMDVVGRWVPEHFDAPIRIGEVSIRPGDHVMADRDGVVIIPGEMVVEVVEATETVLQTENLVRKAILEGMDPREAYSKHGKF